MKTALTAVLAFVLGVAANLTSVTQAQAAAAPPAPVAPAPHVRPHRHHHEYNLYDLHRLPHRLVLKVGQHFTFVRDTKAPAGPRHRAVVVSTDGRRRPLLEAQMFPQVVRADGYQVTYVFKADRPGTGVIEIRGRHGAVLHRIHVVVER